MSASWETPEGTRKSAEAETRKGAEKAWASVFFVVLFIHFTQRHHNPKPFPRLSAFPLPRFSAFFGLI
jgi:hypothetical protein